MTSLSRMLIAGELTEGASVVVDMDPVPPKRLRYIAHLPKPEESNGKRAKTAGQVIVEEPEDEPMDDDDDELIEY